MTEVSILGSGVVGTRVISQAVAALGTQVHESIIVSDWWYDTRDAKQYGLRAIGIFRGHQQRRRT